MRQTGAGPVGPQGGAALVASLPGGCSLLDEGTLRPPCSFSLWRVPRRPAAEGTIVREQGSHVPVLPETVFDVLCFASG